MPSLTDTIEALLWEDESTTLDFKQAQYPFATATDEQKSEIIKDILAFANAFRRDDAYILLGIHDQPGGRATILGVTNHLDDASLQQLVNTKTNRPVEFSYHALTIDGHKLGAIRIPRQQRPTYLKTSYGKLHAQTVYLRHGSSTSTASLEEIARMGTDQQPSGQRYDPEITALQTIHRHARFHERVVRLWENISRIPEHSITNIARSAEYERERRALHVPFTVDHDAFRQAMSSARDILTHHADRVSAAEKAAITEILAALHDVEQTVSDLASWSNSRLDLELPRDKQRDATQAAEKLSTLVARRLVTLGAPTT
jgi:Schlafen, AlbA_2